MHPASLLSYYPTYAILDEIVSFNNYKKIQGNEVVIVKEGILEENDIILGN